MSPLARANAYLAYRDQAIEQGKRPIPYTEWCTRQSKRKPQLAKV